jgi:hypothetical protein
MADNDKKKPDAMVAQEKAAVARTEHPEETRYPREEIIELAIGMFGREAHVVAGALSLLDEGRKTFAKSEVEAALERFDKHAPVIDRAEDN